MANVRAQQWAQDNLEHVEGEELRRSVMCGWNGDESNMKTRANKLTKLEYGSHQWFVLAKACKKLWGVESDRDGKANRDGGPIEHIVRHKIRENDQTGYV